MNRNIVERVRAFNHARQPDLVRLKYQKMRISAFVFFRGTCHLFYEDWPVKSALNAAPLAWLCGDLHLENFGTYKGDNRLTYFDINDFDEAVLAPATWDVARFVTSLLVAAPELKMTKREAEKLAVLFLTTYAETLARGQIRTVERPTSVGMVRRLLHALKTRQRVEFLDDRTQRRKGGRRWKFDEVHLLPATAAERDYVAERIEQFGRHQRQPGFYKVLDVARRVAGTGSLGLRRYAVLVEGKGSPACNYILDLKEAAPSSLQPYLTAPQPAWTSEADRAVEVQRRFQGNPPALLSAMKMENKAYGLRELQPLQDRVHLAEWDGEMERAAKVIETMAEVTAWGQLRSSGRQGSAIADELIAFGQATDWRQEVMVAARQYSAQVMADFDEYAAAYDLAGGFAV
jgi:uncharacterized protein (DUF2252 family)